MKSFLKIFKTFLTIIESGRCVVSEGAERKLTLEELRQFDGRDGRPAYVAFKGKVYDVSDSFLWAGGGHQGQHEAGKDITNEIQFAPHGEEVFDKVKLVGVLIEK